MTLWELCERGDLEDVREALVRGEDVNGNDSDGMTGLMWAVKHKHNSIVEFLLQYPGVDVNCQDSLGGTALHWSVSHDNPEGLRLLLAHPGVRSLNTRTRDGMTPLMAAMFFDSLSCVRELVGVEGEDLDTRDGQGRSLEEVARTSNEPGALADFSEMLRVVQEARQERTVQVVVTFKLVYFVVNIT